MSGSFSFIGGGVMAEAMMQGMISRSIAAKDSILASEPNEKRRSYLVEKYGIGVTASNKEAAASGDTVVLSVKPQVLPGVLAELKGTLTPDQFLISIVTGTKIATLAEGLSHEAVLRAMPNTPAQIGEGMTVWTCAPSVDRHKRTLAKEIFLSLGKEVFLEEEKYLDMATAVSGSGPAYTFFILEALTDAAVHLGFTRDIAKELVLQTMKGAVLYAESTGKHPAELRNQVTTPGGTTAEALYEMEKGSLRAVLSDAVWAAFRKSASLGESSGKDGRR
jgi:pyrroline-5-carboxylate reductase